MIRKCEHLHKSSFLPCCWSGWFMCLLSQCHNSPLSVNITQIHILCTADSPEIRKKTKQKADSAIWKKTDHIGSVAAGETTRQLKQCTLGRWDQRWRLAMMLDTTFGKNQTRHIRTNTVYQLSSTAVSSDDLGLLCTYNADQELCVPNYSRFECEPISLKLGKW